MDARKNRIFAYLDDFDIVTVYLSKFYYGGKTNYFMIKDNETGNINNVEIITTYEKQRYDYMVYKLKICNIEFGKEYDIIEANGLSSSIAYGRIVRTERFEELFATDEVLGAIYSKTGTLFRVWSPTSTKVKLDYRLNKKNYAVDMERTNKGIFQCYIEKDIDGASYCFLIKDGRSWKQVVDPYAISSTANSKYSVVIDLDKINIDVKKEMLPPLTSINDAIIYEVSIRDFTSMAESGSQYRGKYLGMVEEGTTSPNGYSTGIDYLKELGITHIQLLPMYDFATVDEDNPDAYYNWGYDPNHYNVPEGSYATNPREGYSRVKEVKEMVSKFHEAGIRVVMDVVYNHMYDRETCVYENLVPNYFFRYGDNGEISDGSYCGNDVASEKAMVRRIIVDSCMHWIKTYGIDGFRFDLMGIIDIDTIKLIEKKAKEIDPYFIIYGEGWNMPTLLPNDDKTTIDNHFKVPTIGFFNDRFRDVMKGGNTIEQLAEKGYGNGNTHIATEAISAYKVDNYLFPNQSINYVESHDNSTLWDKLSSSNYDETTEDLENRVNLINALVLLSQGIPFLHAGQEFCATKYGEHNSYNKPDAINQVNWLRRDQYLRQVNYMKDLIQFRKKMVIFRLQNREEIDRICFVNLIDYQMIVASYHDFSIYQSDYLEVKVYINPTKNYYRPHSLSGNWVVLFDKSGIVDEKEVNNDVFVEEISVLVIARKD